MQEKVPPSREGIDQDLPNSRRFGLLGSVPVALWIGGGATTFGSLAAEVLGDSPWSVVIAGTLATATVLSFNRTNLNDPLEQPSPSLKQQEVPEVAEITK